MSFSGSPLSGLPLSSEGGSPGIASGAIGAIVVSVISGSATGRASASATIGIVVVTTCVGAATGRAACSGSVGTIVVTTCIASATGRASCSGSVGVVTVTPCVGAATGKASAVGAIGIVAVSTCAGAAVGAASCSGSIGVVSVSTVQGSASHGSGAGNATGEIGTIAVTSLFGSASSGSGTTPVFYGSGVVFAGAAKPGKFRKRLTPIEEDEDDRGGTVGRVEEDRVEAIAEVDTVSRVKQIHVAANASGPLPSFRFSPPQGSATGGASSSGGIGSFVMLAHDRRAPWRSEWRTRERDAYLARRRRAA